MPASEEDRAGEGSAFRLLPDAADLTVSAAACLLAVLIGAAIGRSGEARDWSVYFAIGALFPSIIVAWSWRSAALPEKALAVAAVAIAAALALVTVAHGFAFAIVSAIALVVAWGVPVPPGSSSSVQRFWSTWPLFVVTVAGSAAAATLLWWHDIETPRDALCCAIAAAIVGRFVRQDVAHGERRALRIFITATAALLFFFAATRADRLGGLEGHHHWSYLIGPAELVRSGGWLLSDVPSQYGFLSVLSLAALPARNVWQSLYALNVVLLIAAATYTCALLQKIRRDLFGGVVAIVLAGIAHFLICGQAARMSGPGEYPSTGPYRFLWVYALMAIAFWIFSSSGERLLTGQILGGATWAVAALWSSESFAYATSIWVPTSIVLLLFALQRDDAMFRRRAIAATFAGPLILACAIAIIELFYRLQLGQPPDWQSYIEFSRAYSADIMVLPAQPSGPWIALVLVLVAGAAAAAPLIRNRDFLALVPITAAWGAVWSTLSYYAARSHPNNATNILPIALTAAAITMVVARDRLPRSWPVASAVGALLIAILVAPLTDPAAAADAIRASTGGYRTNIAAALPPTDPELRDLLQRAHVSATDPIVFLGVVAAPLSQIPTDRGTELATRPSLIPAIPSILLDALPEARRQHYLDLYMARHPFARGWILRTDRTGDLRLRLSGQSPAVIERENRVIIGEIARFYRPVAEMHSRRWQLIEIAARR